MALIKCTECGNEVSDRAQACPKCGAPVGQPPKPTAKEIPTEHLSLWISEDTGEIGKPKRATPGSFLIELGFYVAALFVYFTVQPVVGLLLLAGAIAYTLYRFVMKKRVIGSSEHILPIDSPRGRELYERYHGTQSD